MVTLWLWFMSFFKSLGQTSSLTLASRIAGFGREVVFAALFGAGGFSDSMALALKIPAFFRRIFAEGAFHATFVPFYTRLLKNSHHQANILCWQFGKVLMGMLCTLCLVFIVILPWFGKSLLSFPSDWTLYAIQVTFPFLLFITFTAFFSAILNVHHQFGYAASSAAIGNIYIILGLSALYLVPAWQKTLTPWIFMTSGLCQCLWVAWPLARQGFFHLPPALPKDQRPSLHPFLKKFVPTALISSTHQFSLVISTWIAFSLPKGSLSYLHYADRIHQLPLSLIGTALGTVLLPALSRKDQPNLRVGAVMCALTLSIPCALALGISATDIIALLYQRGAFTPQSTLFTAQALQVYAWGLPAHILTKVLVVMFFARHNTRTPLIIGTGIVLLDAALCLTFLPYFHYLGVAYALSLSGWIHALILMRKARSFFSLGPYVNPLVQSIAVMGLSTGILHLCVHSSLVKTAVGISAFLFWLWKTHILTKSTLREWFYD